MYTKYSNVNRQAGMTTNKNDIAKVLSTQTSMDLATIKPGRQKQEKEIVCKRCGNRWVYRGFNPYVTICTFCRTTCQVNPKNKAAVIAGPRSISK
jgi:ribosomal protein L37E